MLLVIVIVANLVPVLGVFSFRGVLKEAVIDDQIDDLVVGGPAVAAVVGRIGPVIRDLGRRVGHVTGIETLKAKHVKMASRMESVL